MFNIIVKRPDNSEENMFFKKNLVKIGRHSANDIVLKDDMASRYHAEIEFYNDKFFIRDLISKNGVFVNESQVLEQSLENGSTIRIGSTSMIFYSSGEEESTRQQKILIVSEESDDKSISYINEQKVNIGEPIESPQIQSFKEGGQPEFLRDTFELSKILLKTTSTNALLGEVMNLIAKDIDFKNAAFFLYDTKGKKLEPAIERRAYNNGVKDDSISISNTIIDTCLKEKTAIFCQNAMDDYRFANSDSIHDFKIKTVACIPLIGKEKNLGIFYIEAAQEKTGFTDDEKQFLISIVNETCLGIENFHLRDERFRVEKASFINKLFTSFNSCVKETLANYGVESNNLKCALETGDINKIRFSFDKLENYIVKLSEFINDVDYYSNPMPLKPSRFNLNVFLNDFTDTIKYVFKSRPLQVSTNFDNTEIDINFDKEAIQRAFMNIIFFMAETLKDIPDKIIEISSEVDTGKNTISVIFQDNGPGHLSLDSTQIFEPFSSLRDASGTGLGLAIARRIIKTSGGSVEYESARNFGTTFVIMLPIQAE